MDSAGCAVLNESGADRIGEEDVDHQEVSRSEGGGEGVPSEFTGHPECMLPVMTSACVCRPTWPWGAGESDGGWEQDLYCGYISFP